jgi:hypothetical protein
MNKEGPPRALCHDMTTHEPPHPETTPLSRLELSLIDEYVRMHGHDPVRLVDLPAGERDALLREASLYASGKLCEVETRSHFVHELHDAIGNVPKPHNP